MAKKFDVSAIVRKHAEIKSASVGGNFVQLQTNVDNPVRLVLFINEKTNTEELYSPEYKVHWINKKPYHCIGVGCPLCRVKEFLEKRDGEKEYISRMRAKKMYAFNAIVDNEIKILEIGSQCTQAILAIFADEDYGNIADLNIGRIVKIKKTGSGLDTEYSALPSPKIDWIKTLPSEPIDLVAWVKNGTKTKEQLIQVVEDTFKLDYNDEVLIDSDVVTDEPDSEPIYKGMTVEVLLQEFTKKELIAKCKKEKYAHRKTITAKALAELLVNDGLPF